MLTDRALNWAVHNDSFEKLGKWGATRLPEITDNWEIIEVPDMVQWYVAGEDRSDVEEYVSGDLNSGVEAIVNYLGEHIEEPEEVERVKNEYTDLLEDFEREEMNACLSVKPSQLGLEIDTELGRQNLYDLAKAAERTGSFLWIDMESREDKDETVDIYSQLIQDSDNVGLCLQAYLEETMEDLRTLQQEGGKIRLVKGAYDRDSDFESSEEIDENYEKLMEQLFEDGSYFAIATHDEDLIQKAQELESESDQVSKNDFEFQVLKGVLTDERQRELVENGYNLAEYVPYGEEGIDYFWRRIQEHPQNMLYGLETVMNQNSHLIPGSEPV